LQPEFYFKTNESLDWNYTHDERLQFLSFPAGISFSKYIALEADLFLGENRMISNYHRNYTNFPFDATVDDVQPIKTDMPKRAYISAGIPFLEESGVNFRLGMGDESYGRTHTDNIVLSESLKGVNYASLTLYSLRVKYTTDIKQYEVNKYLYLHYFQIQPFKRISFSIVEGVMVNAPFEIRFLNPFMIFHGFTAWDDYEKYNKEQIDGDQPGRGEQGKERVGSLVGLLFDWNPFKYTRIYGLAAMNQFELPSERAGDSLIPDSIAFQLGFESFVPVSSGLLNFGLEGVYTSPYMYVLRDKGWSFYRDLKEMSNPTISQWAGTSFGPDSIAGTIWAGFDNISRWSASLSFLFLAQGKNSSTGIFDTDDYDPKTPEEAAAFAPTGIPQYTYQVNASGKWKYSEMLVFSAQAGYTIAQNFGHIDNRLEHGFEVSFSVQFFPKTLWSHSF
jgi:hypothetical protein